MSQDSVCSSTFTLGNVVSLKSQFFREASALEQDSIRYHVKSLRLVKLLKHQAWFSNIIA